MRIAVITSEAERAVKRDAETGMDALEHEPERARIETDLDAACAALRAVDEEHAQHMVRVDADTTRLLQLYWGENLVARPRGDGEAHARLFGLNPPSPSEWRRRGAT